MFEIKQSEKFLCDSEMLWFLLSTIGKSSCYGS